MTKRLLALIQPLFLALLFVFGLVYVHGAWNEPTQSAPSGNTDAPINVGSDAQTKGGDLIVNGLGADALAVYGDAAVTGDVNVAGYIRIGETSVTCNSGSGGTIRYDSVNKEMQYCDTTEWVKMASTTIIAGGGSNPLPLYGGTHTDEDCIAAGGNTAGYNSSLFCRFIQTSCPSGWTRYQNLGTTQSNTCNGNTCGIGTSCSTGSHTFTNATVESCYYARDMWNINGGRNPTQTCVSGGGDYCYASLTSVGCY